MQRWITYLNERFPLHQHGPLVAAFSFCAVSYSAALRGGGWPTWPVMVVAFVSALTFFFQLRVADEHKDFDEDARYRPYRPVPRGLISLRELSIGFIVAALMQVALAFWLDWRLLFILVVVWFYLAAMSKEFFIRDWLKHRPVVYMVSHMIIMPLIDFYATASDWLPANVTYPSGLHWFLLASFFNGMVIEVGRKLRQPDEEEIGVETYSYLWGQRRAIFVWLGLMVATLMCGVLAAAEVRAVRPVAGILIILLVFIGLVSWRFLHRPESAKSKTIEACSGIWTLGLYLSLGLLSQLDLPWLEYGL